MLRWLTGQALPLWAEAGWDDGAGLFVERLDLAGNPLHDAPRRAMVQARQIFSYSVAARRGWCGGFGDRLLPAADTLIRRFYAVDDAPGWIFSVHRSGRPNDTRRDLYAHAFMLLALAEVAATTGERRFLALADETLAFLDAHMAHPAGGYVDALPGSPDGPLRQNPHMHLFEALLALHGADPARDYLDRAAVLAALMERRFLRGSALVEVFDADWTPRGGPDFPFEPGHHFEWAWLLTRFARLSGRRQSGAAAALWRSAIAHGTERNGLVLDEASVGRGALRRSARLWPHAEAAKAACCGLGASEDPSAGDFLAALHDRFLAPAFPGSWIDHFDAGGWPLTDFAPASSLYHICCALDEVVGRVEGW